jgi:5-methylcytosine-specific restriction protein A
VLASKKNEIAAHLTEGTGAAISIQINSEKRRAGLEVWFSDLQRSHGPIVDLRPYGLRGHEVQLRFGTFAAATIDQICSADEEKKILARALIDSIQSKLEFSGDQISISDWPSQKLPLTFKLHVQKKAGESTDDDLVASTCQNVLVPIMGALAELIGYEEIEEVADHGEPEYEGKVLRSVIRRRERNPRNRLLCLRIHGYQCKVCGLDPVRKYGDFAQIIEVHHIQPLFELNEPRQYDPKVDLIPLCPNCHRAVHTPKGSPLDPFELRRILETEAT